MNTGSSATTATIGKKFSRAAYEQLTAELRAHFQVLEDHRPDLMTSVVKVDASDLLKQWCQNRKVVRGKDVVAGAAIFLACVCNRVPVVTRDLAPILKVKVSDLNRFVKKFQEITGVDVDQADKEMARIHIDNAIHRLSETISLHSELGQRTQQLVFEVYDQMKPREIKSVVGGCLYRTALELQTPVQKNRLCEALDNMAEPTLTNSERALNGILIRQKSGNTSNAIMNVLAANVTTNKVIKTEEDNSLHFPVFANEDFSYFADHMAEYGQSYTEGDSAAPSMASLVGSPLEEPSVVGMDDQVFFEKTCNGFYPPLETIPEISPEAEEPTGYGEARSGDQYGNAPFALEQILSK